MESTDLTCAERSDTRSPKAVADVYKWACEQATYIRAARFDLVDLINVAEEIEDVGRSERRAVCSRLTVIMVHLLKWDFQSSLRSRSWSTSVKSQRTNLQRYLRDSPSLRAKLPDLIADAYEQARVDAEHETGLPISTFPEICPYSREAIFERTLSIDP